MATMLEQLAARDAPSPDRQDFGPLQDYYDAWYLWRALQRDRELNHQEADARWQVVEARLDELVRRRGLW